MELQRHAMLMYTSCGWFFDVCPGIRASSSVQYAARALQLAKEILARIWNRSFLRALKGPRQPLRASRRSCHLREVCQTRDDRLAASRGSLCAKFTIPAIRGKERIFSFSFRTTGSAGIKCGQNAPGCREHADYLEITQESQDLSYGVLYLAEYSFTGGVRRFESKEVYETMLRRSRQPSTLPITRRPSV